MKDETPRIAAKRSDVLLAEMIAAILERLDGIEDSPHKRELRARALSYERIVRNWTTVAPSGPQRDAAFELVTELHAKVIEAGR
jgi:hypothetical protein